MRITLYLKQADLAIQLGCLFFPVLLAIYQHAYYDMIYGYMLLGLAQVVSCIINGFALDDSFKHRGRLVYHYVLASIALISLAVIFGRSDDQKACLFYTMIIVSPFLAAWYMWFSYKEARLLKGLIMRGQFTRI